MVLSFVVDTNILFTFFWKNSTTRKIFNETEIRLFSPKYALDEIIKYSGEIQSKTKITKDDFEKIYQEILKRVRFFPREFYQDNVFNFKKVIDEKDIDFIALSFKLKIPLWTNDKELKQENSIKVINTREVIELL
jgi:predicted nucleic acid-binding protein